MNDGVFSAQNVLYDTLKMPITHTQIYAISTHSDIYRKHNIYYYTCSHLHTYSRIYDFTLNKLEFCIAIH